MGRPLGSPNRDKPWADALRMVLFRDDRKALHDIAETCITKAREGDVAAIKEIADRLDGKPPQALEGVGEKGELVIRWLKPGEEP